MAGIGAALRSVAQKGAELARQLTDEATSGLASFKFHREYQIVAQTGTAGSHGLWRIYSAVARSSTALVRDVSIWVLDKRQLLAMGDDAATLQGRSSSQQVQQRWEAVLEQQRHSCAVMTRLKHPGVVRVVQPLAETSGHMVLVTEAVRGCLRELMTTQLQQHQQQRTQQQGTQHGGGGPAGVDPDFPGGVSAASGGLLRAGGSSGCAGGGGGAGGGSALTLLEVKLGLLSLVEVMSFLHGTARMAHCGLSPQSVVVTPDGGWKLAGFSFAVSLPGSRQQGGTPVGPVGSRGSGSSAHPVAPQPPYSYGDPFPQPWEELAKPQLSYTAPELIVPPGGATGPWDAYRAHLPSTTGGLLLPPADANPFMPPEANPFLSSSSAPSLPPPSPLDFTAADAFSLGALSYEAIAVATLAEGGSAASWGQWSRSDADMAYPPQLLPVRCSLQQYGSRLAALAAVAPAFPTAAPPAGPGVGGIAGGGGGGSLGFLPGAGSSSSSSSNSGGVGAGGLLAADLARVPPELHGVLLAFVSPSPACRPPLASLARLDWLDADPLLRALRFLEGMMQSEPRHKLAFLVDLADERRANSSSWRQGGSAVEAVTGGALWRLLPDRLLSSRVLPPLLQEVRTGAQVGVAALPVAMAVVQHLGRAAFAALALPLLTPVLEAAAGAAAGSAAAGGSGGAPPAVAAPAVGVALQEQQRQAMLAALVGQAEVLAGLMDGPTTDRLLVPLLLRAVLGPAAGAAEASAGTATPAGGTLPPAVGPRLADPRLALAALGQLRALLEETRLLDGRSPRVRSQLLQPLLTAAARTTSAGVRASCLGVVKELAGKVDRPEGEAILSTCAQLLSVDSSGGTILAVAGVLQSLSEAWGPVAAAQRLLPMLVPLLVAASLTAQQLAPLTSIVQAMLSRIVLYTESAVRMHPDGAFPPPTFAGGGLPAAAAAARPEAAAMSTVEPASASHSRRDDSGHPSEPDAAAAGALAFTTWPSSSSNISSSAVSTSRAKGFCSTPTAAGMETPLPAAPSAGQQAVRGGVTAGSSGLLAAVRPEWRSGLAQACYVPQNEAYRTDGLAAAWAPQLRIASDNLFNGAQIAPHQQHSVLAMMQSSPAAAGPAPLATARVSDTNDNWSREAASSSWLAAEASAALDTPRHGGTADALNQHSSNSLTSCSSREGQPPSGMQGVQLPSGPLNIMDA